MHYKIVSMILLNLSLFTQTTFAQEQVRLVQNEISRINGQIRSINYPIRELTLAHFNKALKQSRKYFFPKPLRKYIDTALAEGTLNSRAQIILDESATPYINFSVQVNESEISTINLIAGDREHLENPEDRADCSRTNLCAEPLFYSPTDSKKRPERIPIFQYEIRPIDLTFTADQIRERPEVAGFRQRGLQIYLTIEKDNIANIVNYFGIGQDQQSLRNLIRAKMGRRTRITVDLKDLMPSAVRKSVNRYPTTKDGDFDVCYNAASTFYNVDHRHGNNSTELLQSIINRYYCPRRNYNEIRFGDILYSGGHVVRYIMYDNHNDDHIVYEMNSGGYSAWRFISLRTAFQYEGDHETQFRGLYDTYYRCR